MQPSFNPVFNSLVYSPYSKRGYFPGSSGYAPLTSLALDGLSPVLAVSPQYLGGTGNGQAWADARYPTVKVEKGYGSAVYQDLYPDPTTGELFTGPNGTGQTATAYAGSSKLFVEIPYNQALAGPLASGHPSVVTDASRRVMLDISTPTAPRFAGIQQGTQDASQSATERGYDTNVSVTTSGGLTFLSLDALPSSGTTDYRPIQNNGGTTQNILVNPGNYRWYAPEGSVATINPIRMPSIKCAWRYADASIGTYDAGHAVCGGVSHENAELTPNATSTPMRIWGTTTPLTGSCYAVVILAGYPTITEIGPSGSLMPRLHKTCKGCYGANEVTVYSPIANQGFKLTSYSPAQGTIRIVCASAANRGIEASFNGGSWASIGTTDANGYLVGTLTGQAAGSGTLSIRVAGQVSAAATVSNVRVGFMVTRGGQSNADGRGDNITLTATRSIASSAWANSTATQKSWIWALLQDRATALSCPVIMGGRSAGSTRLYFDSGGTSDGRHGHWAYNNPGTVIADNFAILTNYAFTQQTEPNFCIWHQGEEDAANGNTKAQYKTALVNMWTEFQSRTGWANKLWVMSLGRNSPVSDANTDAIRLAQIEAVNENPTLFEMGGCLAHLTVGDGGSDLVHFWTQAQKDAVVAVFLRHALGSGRGPRFSSMVASGTTITIQCTGGVTPLTISGGEAASPIGWTVTDGGGSKTVTAVAVSNLQITLTVNSSLSGTVTVKWLSGATGIGTTLLDSDGTTPVPPEPFSQSVVA